MYSLPEQNVAQTVRRTCSQKISSKVMKMRDKVNMTSTHSVSSGMNNTTCFDDAMVSQPRLRAHSGSLHTLISFHALLAVLQRNTGRFAQLYRYSPMIISTIEISS